MLESEGGIGAAEAEGVGEDAAQGEVGRGLDKVEAADGIGLIDRDVRGDESILKGHEAKDGLDGAGAAEEMSGAALGGADADAGDVISGPLANGGALGGVVEDGAGAVGVEVVHVGGGPAGLVTGGGHALQSGEAFGVGLGEVMEVGAAAVADDLSEDGGAAGEGVVKPLEGEDGGAFAQGEAVAVGGEGSGEGGGEGLEGIEAGENELGEGVVTAGEGAAGAAVFDEVEGMADGVGAGGAGVGNDLDRTVDLESVGKEAELSGGLVELGEVGEAALAPGGGDFFAVVGLAEAHGGGAGAEAEGDGFLEEWSGPSGVMEALEAGEDEHAGGAVQSGDLAWGKT